MCHYSVCDITVNELCSIFSVRFCRSIFRTHIELRFPQQAIPLLLILLSNPERETHSRVNISWNSVHFGRIFFVGIIDKELRQKQIVPNRIAFDRSYFQPIFSDIVYPDNDLHQTTTTATTDTQSMLIPPEFQLWHRKWKKNAVGKRYKHVFCLFVGLQKEKSFSLCLIGSYCSYDQLQYEIWWCSAVSLYFSIATKRAITLHKWGVKIFRRRINNITKNNNNQRQTW